MKATSKHTAENPPTVVAPGRLKELTGSSDDVFGNVLANEVFRGLWMPDGAKREDQDKQIKAALVALKGIAPSDELEGMLAAQMVACHAAAMECYRRAMLPQQTFDGRQAALKYAAKMSRLYADQVQALAKHRGKGRQLVRVEHVTVNADQAIVGSTINQSPGVRRGSASNLEEQPHAITNAPEPAMPRTITPHRETVPSTSDG